MGRLALGRWSRILVGVAVIGCGGTTQGERYGGPQGRHVLTPVGDIEIQGEDLTRRDEIPAPVGRVTRALVTAYERSGLDPDWVDPEKNIVGRTEINLSRELDGRALAEFFHCGITSTGSQIAAHSRVTVSVVSNVETTETGSSLATQVEAVAHPLTAEGGQWHECTSTGELESTLRQRVANLLGLR